MIQLWTQYKDNLAHEAAYFANFFGRLEISRVTDEMKAKRLKSEQIS